MCPNWPVHQAEMDRQSEHNWPSYSIAAIDPVNIVGPGDLFDMMPRRA